MAGSQRFLSQAAQDAILKFAPQRTALSEALQTARENYGSTVHAGNVTAGLTQGAVSRALPRIGQIYSKADSAQQAGTTLLNADLAKLPGVASNYKADQIGEVAQQLSNLLGARSRDEAQLVNTGVQARAGAQFNQTNARAALEKTVAGLISKSNTTSQEQGAFAATEAEKLAHEAETLQQRERASQRTAASTAAGHRVTERGQNLTRQSAREAHGAGGASGAVKPLTASENAKAGEQLYSILNYAKGFASHGLGRGEILQKLVSGRAAQTVGVNAKGDPVGEGEKAVQHVKLGAVPQFKPDVLMSAALDLALGGEISRHTQHRLESAGYNLGALSLKPSRGRYGAPPKPISPGPHRRPA